jgi:hypothetical protein
MRFLRDRRAKIRDGGGVDYMNMPPDVRDDVRDFNFAIN